MKIIKTYQQITESHQYRENIHLLTQEQIDWCDNHLYFSDWNVSTNGKINSKLIYIYGNFKSFPVSFENCVILDIKDNDDLEDLTGCPDHVDVLCRISNCPNLKSLTGGPTEVSSLEITKCGLIDMSGSPLSNRYLIADCPQLESISGIPYSVNPDKIVLGSNGTDRDKLISDFIRGYTDSDYRDYEKDWTF